MFSRKDLQIINNALIAEYYGNNPELQDLEDLIYRIHNIIQDMDMNRVVFDYETTTTSEVPA